MSEKIINGAKMNIANSCIQAISLALTVACNRMDQPGEKVAMAGGCAIPGLSGIAAMMSANKEQFATPDQVTFGALYVICAVEVYKGNQMMIGFSPDLLAKALAMYKTLTGREYTNIDPHLLELLESEKTAASQVPETVKKFLPN